MSDRLAAQIAFLTEADKLKSVYRATNVLDGHRKEDTGSHSWHIALYAHSVRTRQKRHQTGPVP